MTDTLPFHHAPGGSFRNLPGSPERTASSGNMARFVFEQVTAGAPEIPDDHVLNKTESRRQLAVAGNPSVTWLGHATFIIRIAGKTVLTDPFLGNTAGPAGLGPRRFVPSAMTVGELPKVDVMVVSHNHYDHLDAGTIESYRFKASTQVIVPLGLGSFLRNAAIRTSSSRIGGNPGNRTISPLPLSPPYIFQDGDCLIATRPCGQVSRLLLAANDSGFPAIRPVAKCFPRSANVMAPLTSPLSLSARTTHERSCEPCTRLLRRPWRLHEPLEPRA